jgi:hypothetical protein
LFVSSSSSSYLLLPLLSREEDLWVVEGSESRGVVKAFARVVRREVGCCSSSFSSSAFVSSEIILALSSFSNAVSSSYSLFFSFLMTP